MTVTTFRWYRGMIVVSARLQGPRGGGEVRLALDTGATKTLIIAEVMDDLGYSARDGDQATIIRTANAAPEPGYTLRVQRFSALGFEHENFEIHVHDLPDYGIEGLVGMNFLESYNFTVRPRDKQIRLEPVEAGSGPRAA
jgi:predicted aspartyl protease